MILAGNVPKSTRMHCSACVAHAGCVSRRVRVGGRARRGAALLRRPAARACLERLEVVFGHLQRVQEKGVRLAGELQRQRLRRGGAREAARASASAANAAPAFAQTAARPAPPRAAP